MKVPPLFPETESLPLGNSESFRTREGETRFSFHRIREEGKTSELHFHAARGSNLEGVIFQNLPGKGKVRLRIRASAEAGACLKLTVIQAGAGRSLVELQSEALGADARMEVRGLNVAGDGQNIHLHAESIHSVPGTGSDLQVWNVARGSSRTVFEGLIRIGKGASRTDAYQKNRNLILSERAVVDSIPKLLIANDDVKCAHGSSTSTLDAEQEIYLRSRGISREEAERMMVGGFLRQALSSIGDSGCRTAIEAELGLAEEDPAEGMPT